MADEHSEPGGMKVLRLYADALGESRFETTTMPMALKEFAPVAVLSETGQPHQARHAHFSGATLSRFYFLLALSCEPLMAPRFQPCDGDVSCTFRCVRASIFTCAPLTLTP
jgi:hypothetical protein